MGDVTFTGTLHRWEAAEAWHFVTLPVELADLVRLAAGPPRGFGSVRVEVTVGATTWRTSLFPESRSESYVLPVRKAVRVAEGLEDGDRVHVTLRVLTP